tara:strand:+ start:268 stop:633 length:366 start_codon:yes stop_codon:yes gene_type:complete
MKLDRKSLMERAGLKEASQDVNPYKQYISSGGDDDFNEATAVSDALADVDYQTYVEIIDGITEKFRTSFTTDDAVNTPGAVQDWLYSEEVAKKGYLPMVLKAIKDMAGRWQQQQYMKKYNQ